MGTLDVRSIYSRIADWVATRRRLARFQCGDCDRWQQCGDLPTEDCAVRAEQIERDGDRPPSRTPVLPITDFGWRR